MQKLKVLFVINRLKLGGAQRVVITLARSMRDLGHDTHIICFKRSEELVGAQDLDVHYVERSLAFLPLPVSNRLRAAKLDRYVRDHIGEPNLVLSNLTKANRILVHSSLPNIHIIVHNTLTDAIQKKEGLAVSRWLRARKFRSIYMKKACIACGDGVYQDFLKLMPDHPSVHRIFNAVDNHQIRAWSSEKTSPFNNYVVHVGSFIRDKRHDVLLLAYKEAAIKESLVLLGTGELEMKVRQQAEDLGIENKVIFAGFHSNPYPIIANARLMICSSDYEGLSLALLEALALGVPVISTDCNSGPREILPARNMVPAGDVSALGAKVREAMANRKAFACPLPAKFKISQVTHEYLALAQTPDI
ncbi:MAG: glycosyltransferase [Halioglobus sp.]|nr:glycosyltransferase [Halioglobus sp.]